MVRVVPLDAGEVGHTVVSAHHKDESQHDSDPKVDPLVCHGGYHFPGILTGVVTLHTAQRQTQVKGLIIGLGIARYCTIQFNSIL